MKTTMKFSEAKTLTKAELRVNLANQRCDAYPALYAGHWESALKFVKYHYPTKADLLLAGACLGLWGFAHAG